MPVTAGRPSAAHGCLCLGQEYLLKVYAGYLADILEEFLKGGGGRVLEKAGP